MPKHTPLAVSAILCLCWLGLLAVTLWDGLTFLSFFDEATHILGGRMLNSGAVLYRDFVDSHGPFIFFLAQVYGLVAGWSNPNTARVVNILFVACSVVSIATSPALGSATTRLTAVAAFAGLLSAVWLRQGLFMVSFYPIAGALAGISLSSLALPAALAAGASRLHAAAAGFALALLGAVAYSFLPVILLFSAVVIWNSRGPERRQPAGWFVLGEAVGAALLLAYLCRFADLHGFLSFHFAESQFIYAHYIHFSFATFIHSLRPSASPRPGCRASWLAARQEARSSWVRSPCVAGNPRGSCRCPAFLPGFWHSMRAVRRASRTARSSTRRSCSPPCRWRS